MEILVANKEHSEIIKNLAFEIWPSAYGDILSEIQLDYMLNKFYNIEAIENQIIEQKQIFLLIQENEKYLGFCAYELNYEATNKTKLHKLYVLPETQGKGFGKILLNRVEKAASDNKNDTVLLNVNRFNKALDFYKRQSYIITEEIDIEIGNGYLMEDFVMEKIL